MGDGGVRKLERKKVRKKGEITYKQVTNQAILKYIKQLNTTYICIQQIHVANRVQYHKSNYSKLNIMGIYFICTTHKHTHTYTHIEQM